MDEIIVTGERSDSLPLHPRSSDELVDIVKRFYYQTNDREVFFNMSHGFFADYFHSNPGHYERFRNDLSGIDIKEMPDDVKYFLSLIGPARRVQA